MATHTPIMPATCRADARLHDPAASPPVTGLDADNVIRFPVREKPLPMLRAAVADLPEAELLHAAGNLIGFAREAAERRDDADFFDRTKAAYACLERILIEGGRL